MTTLGKRARRVTATLLIFAMALSGCAQGMQVPTMAGVTEIFVDPRTYLDNDVCAKHRRPFVEIREQQRETIRNWSAIAATAGFTIGVAAVESNRLLGGLFGAVTGLVLGATAGYYFDLKQRMDETSEIRAATDRDARELADRGDRLVRSVSDLNRCRLERIQAVEADIRDDRIGAEEAKRRLEAILAEADRDNRLIGSVTDGLKKQTGMFIYAAQQSGAEDVDSFVTRAESYEPRVSAPKYTARRVQPIALASRGPRGGNGISAAVETSSELTAMQEAHLAAVDERIETVEALLL